MHTLQEIKNAFFPTEVCATIKFIDTAGKDTKAGKVYTVHISDETGICKLSIWDAEKLKPLKEGMKIMITKSSANIFQGDLQLSLAKDGEIKIIS